VFAQAFGQGAHRSVVGLRCAQVEHADARPALGTHIAQRPCAGGDRRQQLAALHSITSSARGSSVRWIVTAIAMAVQR
jgi:hypothetical protein